MCFSLGVHRCTGLCVASNSCCVAEWAVELKPEYFPASQSKGESMQCTHGHTNTHYQKWLGTDVLLPWQMSEFLEDESRNPGMRCPEGPRHIPVSLELFFSTASPEGSAPHAHSPSQMRDHTSFVFFSTRKRLSLHAPSSLLCSYFHGLLALP